MVLREPSSDIHLKCEKTHDFGRRFNLDPVMCTLAKILEKIHELVTGVDGSLLVNTRDMRPYR